MNILVIGCGKVGAALCSNLSAQGHDVSVIDSNQDKFSNLSPDFSGYTFTGVAIDQDVLKKAGAENCDALAAVTSDDNTNLMVIQIAKEFFHVPKVFARVNDPKKDAVFTEFGLTTICPTNITVATLCSVLNNETASSAAVGEHTVVMSEMDSPREFVGKRISEIEFEKNETLIAIEHEDKTISMVFLKNMELCKGDKLIIAKIAESV